MIYRWYKKTPKTSEFMRLIEVLLWQQELSL
nr:MAG TPA: hypothetical protein [Caudoviricetes sp.]